MSNVVYCPGMTIRGIKKEVLRQALVYHGGNRTKTAAALGLSIRTLRNWIRKFGTKEGGL